MAPPRSALAIRIVAEYLELMPLSARGLGGLTHKQIAGEIIGHGLKRIARLRRGVFGMRMIHVHAPSIGCEGVRDIALRFVGKHVGTCSGAGHRHTPHIVHRILLPVVPTNMPRLLIACMGNHIE